MSTTTSNVTVRVLPTELYIIGVKYRSNSQPRVNPYYDIIGVFADISVRSSRKKKKLIILHARFFLYAGICTAVVVSVSALASYYQVPTRKSLALRRALGIIVRFWAGPARIRKYEVASRRNTLVMFLHTLI